MRAHLLLRTRAFFEARGVLEVETPVLGAAPVTDPHLHSLSCYLESPDLPAGRACYLQTSPEFAMKRLLASGSGAIYQLARVFRNRESGRLHNAEFTLLEWYRPGFDHHQLMDEVNELLGELLETPPAERISYQEAFVRHAGIDPHRAALDEIQEAARDRGAHPGSDLGEDRDTWLQLLLVHAVEPHLGAGRPTFLYDFPASQAALAKIRDDDPPVAERFEVYFKGVELANGFHELTDAREQRRRFEADRVRRRELGLESVPLDERLLAALESGLPACAGVALGFDRLVLLAAGADRLDEVIAFPTDRA